MFFISPPFGNHINHPNAISITGSYTLNSRPGLIKQTIKTLRPIKNGWINKIGLRNCGIKNVKFNVDKIYSLAALEQNDWVEFLEIVPETVYGVELNLGCPNENFKCIEGLIKEYVQKYSFVSVKLPPDEFAFYYVDFGLRHNVNCFHMCNTLQTKRGGESGKRLKDYSIQIIKEVRKYYGNDFDIIGGGGIYTSKDANDYRNAGANYFSLSTVWFNPLNALNIIKEQKKVDKGK